MSSIETIKNHVPLIDVVENYTELKGGGNRLRAVENPLREGGDLDVYQDTQKYYDQGTGEGGDVIDFIQIVEDLSRADAISFLSEKYLHGVDIDSKPRPLPRMRNKPVKKNNDYLLAKVETDANRYLSAKPTSGMKWGYFKLDIEEFEGETRTEHVIRVHPIFEKLFEDYIVPTDRKFAKYLFEKVVGYCEYFNCPAIVIRDESETVVNIIQYRPERNGKPLMQSGKPLKYLNLRSEDTPDSNYLFPLQAQMMNIMQHEKYCYVGEGLKNAINASLMGIPFVSIEGAASIKPGLINFLKSDRMKNVAMIGAFDGDQAGERAYKKMNDQVPMANQFAFDSGTDFTDYLRGWR